MEIFINLLLCIIFVTCAFCGLVAILLGFYQKTREGWLVVLFGIGFFLFGFGACIVMLITKYKTVGIWSFFAGALWLMTLLGKSYLRRNNDNAPSPK